MSRKTRFKCVYLVFLALTLLQVESHAQQADIRPLSVAGEYIVKFKKPADGQIRSLSAVKSLGAEVSVKEVYEELNMINVEVSSEEARQKLSENPEVEFIEPNYIFSIDPLNVSALGVPPQSGDDYKQSNSDHLVKITASWALQKPYNQGTKIIVAVIDTGLDANHDLFQSSGALWRNTTEVNGSPGVDDDGNGFVDDKLGWNFISGNANNYDDNLDGHGTHVAGIVLGVGQDILATPARESKIKIMSLKVLDKNGSGPISHTVSAIYYAVRNGAKVINNSLGSKKYSQALHEAYTYAYNQGVVIASAAGNEGTNNDGTPFFPANLDSPNNITVAASNDFDERPSFSNFGPSKVHLAAPGKSILSAGVTGFCYYNPCFATMSGTSMATPMVAGLAALILREAPQLSPYQVKSLITGSVDSVLVWKNIVSSGGRINVEKAIQSAKAAVSTPSWKPSYDPNYSGYRGLAGENEQVATGCGLVKAVIDSNLGGGSGSAPSSQLPYVMLFLFLLPLLAALALREKQQSQLQSY